MAITKKEIFFRTVGGNASAEICFDEGLFFADSRVYSHALARLCAVFSTAGYDMSAERDEGISAALTEIGMTDIELYSESLREEVGYFIAHRDVCFNGEKRALVFAAFLGSRYAQWYTNFDAGTGETHDGFGKAADFAFLRLDAYLKKYFAEDENCVILLTGHSRGAASANLLAARLIDTGCIKPERIFTYTFASPTLTRNSETDSERYRGIFNFVNGEDFVTRCMPNQWGYSRYGKTVTLPCRNNLADYEKYLETVNGFYSKIVPNDRYVPYRNGTKKMDSLFKKLVKYVPDIDAYYNRKFRLCGTKVTLFDFFEDSLCAIIGEPAGSPKIEQGTKTLVKTSVMRPASSRALRLISDFFIFYEGMAGFTQGKVFKKYFSYGHDVYTYCALVEAVSDSQLKEINENLR